jgi:hypothetical protein
MQLPFKPVQYVSPLEARSGPTQIKNSDPQRIPQNMQAFRDYSLISPRGKSPVNEPTTNDKNWNYPQIRVKSSSEAVIDHGVLKPDHGVLKPSNGGKPVRAGVVMNEEIKRQYNNPGSMPSFDEKIRNLDSFTKSNEYMIKSGFDPKPKASHSKIDEFQKQFNHVHQSKPAADEENFLEFELKRSRATMSPGGPIVQQWPYNPANQTKKEQFPVVSQMRDLRSSATNPQTLCTNCVNQTIVDDKVTRAQREREQLFLEQKEYEKGHLQHLEDLRVRQNDEKNMMKTHFGYLNRQVESRATEASEKKTRELQEHEQGLLGQTEEMAAAFLQKKRTEYRQELSQQINDRSVMRSQIDQERFQVERTGLDVDEGFRNHKIPSREEYQNGLQEQIQEKWRNRFMEQSVIYIICFSISNFARFLRGRLIK